MASEQARIAAALPAYEVGEELGRGGSGIVLAGVHRTLGREVAIKQLPREFGANPEHRTRFVQEARTLASFDHPHIVPIFDYVEHEGTCLLVMERLTGGTLWDRMHAEGGLSPLAACGVALAACAGLHYAHQKGTLHRDVKPENLMFSASGTLKITDFGIAKVIGSVSMATRTGLVVGTPAYISPEQAQSGELGPWTDVYALGTVLYELLARQLPYREVTDQVVFLYQHVHEDPAPLQSVAPAIPEPVAAAVDRAIQRAPADRYASAEEFGAALAAAASASWGDGWLDRTGVEVMGATRLLHATGATAEPGGGPTSAGSAPPPVPSPGGGRSTAPTGRRRVLVGLLGLVVVLAVAAAVILLGGDDDGGDGDRAGGPPDGPAATSTTEPDEGTGDGLAASAVTLAGALAVSLEDLPSGFEQRMAGELVEPGAIDDPCLSTLPVGYQLQAIGDSFGNDDPGLEVTSTVALAADPDGAAANVAAIRSGAFVDCVEAAATGSVSPPIESVVLERTTLSGVPSYVTSWVLEARTATSAGLVESVVLSSGRAVVTVSFLSTDARVTEEFRDAVLRAVDARLRATAG